MSTARTSLTSNTPRTSRADAAMRDKELRKNARLKVVRPSSLHYRDRQERGEPIPLHTLTAPHLPRAASLRPLNCEFDWTGAPKSIFHRQVEDREILTSPVNGSFFPLPATSPLALGPHPPTDLGASYPVVPYPSSPQTFFPTSSHNNNTFNTSAVRGSQQNVSDFGGSFLSESGDFLGAPAHLGSFDSNRSPSRESRGSEDGSASGAGSRDIRSLHEAASLARNSMRVSIVSSHRPSSDSRASLPAIRRASSARRMSDPRSSFYSPLTKAKNLEQKAAIEAKFNMEKPAVENGGNDEEDEAHSKKALLLLKPYVADESVQLSWNAAEPLSHWRRVKADSATATKVVGLSLAASRLSGDLADLVPLFAMLPQLSMLLLQGNPGVTGELAHLSVLTHLEELRLPGESIHGNLSALSGLSSLKKFQVYNKTKDIEGAPRDLQKQLPHCAIDVYIVSISTAIPA